MDTHVGDTNNGLTSNSHHYSSENAEINIDNIIAAVTQLNIRIFRLREEIVAFKNENIIHSAMTNNLIRYD